MIFKPIVIKPTKPRDPFAMHAMRRKAAVLKDKRAPRKGSTNKQRDYMEGKY